MRMRVCAYQYELSSFQKYSVHFKTTEYILRVVSARCCAPAHSAALRAACCAQRCAAQSIQKYIRNTWLRYLQRLQVRWLETVGLDILGRVVSSSQNRAFTDRNIADGECENASCSLPKSVLLVQGDTQRCVRAFALAIHTVLEDFLHVLDVLRRLKWLEGV